MSPEHVVLSRVSSWADRYRRGRVRDWALLSPKLRKGERFGAKLGSIGISRLPEVNPLSGIDQYGDVKGLAYGTSQRLVIANAGRIKRFWEWSEVEDVLVVTGYVGVVLRTAPDQAEAVHQVHLPHDMWPARPEVLAARWLAIEGCFQDSRGRLDDWLARLPQRVLG